ncbi:uncharacterized protein J3D65DRAFT_629464 [Phyllosticta citribraziliensis]|uniref:Uncharacterized protein n=1 Tax=Phyllosticta citribraziliensis TaxID=989973 RepID=A0ABR1LMG1_9PEZI
MGQSTIIMAPPSLGWCIRFSFFRILSFRTLRQGLASALDSLRFRTNHVFILCCFCTVAWVVDDHL